ncbi:hypothetical protein ARSEF4850_008255 [Beauveria asiatica]
MEKSSKTLGYGYQKLYKWIQREFKTLNVESPQINATMRKALTVLAARPSLFQNSLDFFADGRQHILSDSFFTALTGNGSGRGSAAAKPIDMIAHDPLRYVGDMLAWVHSAAVSEREILEILFVADSEELVKGINSSRDAELWRIISDGEDEDFNTLKALNNLVDRDVSGAARLLRQRVEQVIQSNEDSIVAFKLGHLIKFYGVMLLKLLGPGCSLLDSVRSLEKEAMRQFRALLREHIAAVRAEPQSMPSDLDPPVFLQDALKQIQIILSTCETSLSTAEESEESIDQVLAEAVDPFILDSEALAKSMPTLHRSIYLINCRLALANCFKKSNLAKEREEQLMILIDEEAAILTDSQLAFFHRGSGLYDLITIIKQRANFDADSITADKLSASSTELDHFLPSAYIDALERLGELQDSGLARKITEEAAERFCEDFELLEKHIDALDTAQSGGEDDDNLRSVFPRTVGNEKVASNASQMSAYLSSFTRSNRYRIVQLRKSSGVTYEGQELNGRGQASVFFCDIVSPPRHGQQGQLPCLQFTVVAPSPYVTSQALPPESQIASSEAGFDINYYVHSTIAMLRNRVFTALQKTYDESYLSCSTAGDETEALRHWRNALALIYEHNATKANPGYGPQTDTEKALVDALRELELQCGKPSNTPSPFASPMKAKGSIGSGTIPAVTYSDLSRPALESQTTENASARPYQPSRLPAKRHKEERSNGSGTADDSGERSERRSASEVPIQRKAATRRTDAIVATQSTVFPDQVPRHRRRDQPMARHVSVSSTSGDDVDSQNVKSLKNKTPVNHGTSVHSNATLNKLKPSKRKVKEDPVKVDSSSEASEETEESIADKLWKKKKSSILRNLPPGVDESAAKQILNDIVVKGDEVRWGDIAGLEIAKNALRETVVYPFLRPDLFMGLREPARGMLLFGPPGTGKTMLARAVATESRSTFFSISASSLTSKYLGESEKLVRALFGLARSLAPSIIFVDEIDALLSQRSGSGEHEATRRIKTEFLIQWSDLQRAAAGRETTERDRERGDANRVLVLAATNLPWAIDEAARRRFVRRQYIPLPEPTTRETQIRTLLGQQKHSLSPRDVQRLVGLTDGFSGSDITALAKDAAMGPLRSLGEALLHMTMDEIRPISLVDFEASLRTIRPSVSKSGLKEYEDWANEFGERGG